MESRAPQRTCIGCRRRNIQEFLLRISRGRSGEVGFTTDNRRAGRGAYVCPRNECVEAALKGDRLARALRGPVGPDEKSRLKSSLIEHLDAKKNAEDDDGLCEKS